MKKQLTNKEIIRQAQAKIIARAENNQDYTEEQHLKDINLIYELTLLLMKYKQRKHYEQNTRSMRNLHRETLLQRNLYGNE